MGTSSSGIQLKNENEKEKEWPKVGPDWIALGFIFLGFT
jgi:hypothetical protein